MNRTELLQGVRQMRFEEVYRSRQSGRLSVGEAAEVLGISERTFRRWSCRYEEEGLEGLADRRLGRVSGRRAPVDEVMAVLSLFETQYADFTVSHFYEKLVGDHGVSRSYTWTKKVLQQAGKVKKAPRRGAHRRKRPRRPLPGMMLHQDGSTHEWLPGQQSDLIVTMDDATNEIYSAFLVEQEGTMSSFLGVAGVIESRGLFSSLYVDRASHYWHTKEAGGPVDKSTPTQFNRALKQLGIQLIPAYSPQARGRSERVFRTIQDRLPKELRLAKISTMAQANRYLREIFLPAHNKRFAVKPTEEGTAFIPWIGGHLDDILCVQEERVVANDNTVSYRNLRLQIPKDQHRYHYVKATVTVHEYPDNSLAIFHGPRRLARYDSNGNILETTGGVQKAA